MEDQSLNRDTRARLWTGTGVALLVIVLVIVVSLYGRGPGPESPPATTETSPALQEDTEVRDTASLTVPQTMRTATGSFEAAAGRLYLVQFELSTTKPAGSPGAAMYLGVSLNCVGETGDGNESAGGTQNIINGEPTTLRNQFLLVGDGGKQSCNISVSAPYPGVAAAGTTIKIDMIWTAKPVNEHSFEVDSAERLPMSVSVEDRELAFIRAVDLDNMRGQRITVFHSIHLTACTGVNGSWENGRAWCDAATVDPEGSKVEIALRADVLDAEGQPCDEIGVYSDKVYIDMLKHHQLMNLVREIEVPHESCGSSLRFSSTVVAAGPAPVVVHGSASSFVAVVGEPADEGGAETE
jgi:hypothetical protein